MILFLSDLWLPFPGGAERLAYNLARDLMRRGEQVQVLTGYEYPQQFDGPPVKAQPIGIGPGHDIGWSFIANAINEYDPDVIVTHHLYAYEFEEELLTSGIPIVQVVLNTRRIDGIAFALYISKWLKHTMHDDRPGDLVMVPPAFDDVVADTHGDKIGMIKALPHKGIELFYNVAAAFPGREFVVLRGEWQDLETIIELPNITFMEPVDDIRDFYRQCRIVLVPSLNEDAGTVAQECAMNGLPCISSNVEGLAEANGGIQLPHTDLGAWILAVEMLDNPTFYAAVVDRQHEHRARAHQQQRLNEFAQRIREITRVKRIGVD